jgi:hypothetical protein
MQHAVVGHVGFEFTFDHGVAAGTDLDSGTIVELRFDPACKLGLVGESSEGVQRGDGIGRCLQRGYMR